MQRAPDARVKRLPPAVTPVTSPAPAPASQRGTDLQTGPTAVPSINALFVTAANLVVLVVFALAMAVLRGVQHVPA